MVEVLITGSTVIVSENEIIRDGYVFIRNGLVEDLGEQPPPEDYTYASLILGGQGRIVAPGLTALASLISYPFRFLRPNLRRRIELLKVLSPGDAALLSLAGVYELHMLGVTSIVAEGIGYDYLAKVRELAGGKYGLAYPSCLGDIPKPPEWSLGTIAVSDESCSDERNGLRYDRDDILIFINRRFYTLTNEENVIERSNNLRKVLGLNDISIRRKSLAEIVIYDVRRPPAMFLDLAPDEEVVKVYTSGARVETLVVGDEVLIDGGEHLYIVEKHFNEIRKVVSRLLQNT